MQSIETRFTKILAEHLGIASGAVTSDAMIVEGLGADSLDVVELVMDAEEEFGIFIMDDECEAIRTVGQAISLIKEKVNSPQPKETGDE